MTRRWFARGVTALAFAAAMGSGPHAAQRSADVEIKVLSNRADLVSGGDALIEVAFGLPSPRGAARVRVFANGQDVTSAFSVRSDGRFWGLLTGLHAGPNALRVDESGRTLSTLVVTNHPIGGPLFSGPQIQPWTCNTTSPPSLGEPVNSQCDAPTQFRYVYKSTAGTFQAFEPGSPLPTDVTTVRTPSGATLPYIVRIERGTMNRGLHEIAVLFDPSRPWQPWAPQPQWRNKLLLLYGAGTSQQYRQGTPESVLNDEALALGFVVASSSMLINSQHANFVTAAETSMMLKEHVIEAYGELRYTVAAGGSGGALLQHLVADAYPGILDGLRPTQDWEDSISGAYREFADSAAIVHAFGASALTVSSEHRAAIGGWGAANVNVFNIEGGRVGDYNRPDDGTRCAGDESYDAATRPNGTRCTFQDFIANQIGRRPDGTAELVFDNVGVQYGLAALNTGQITAEEFVEVNVRAGGFDANGRWQPARSAISPTVAARLYRTGQVTFGRGLSHVAEIAIRGTNNNDYHYPFRTMVNRNRLIAANGHADNHVFWIQPQGETTLVAMDRWLSAVVADRSAATRSEKIARDRPADVSSACWIDGAKVTDLAVCDVRYPYFREPRTIAGDSPTISTMKCQLKPRVQADYQVTFTEAQWAALETAFPSGVCDFSKPGIGAQPSTPWLTYSAGPDGIPLGDPPRSKP